MRKWLTANRDPGPRPPPRAFLCEQPDRAGRAGREETGFRMYEYDQSYGREAARVAVKWWHWSPYVGRWMPSEPPQGVVNAAYWCASDAVPTVTGPSLGGDNNRKSPSPMPVSESSSASPSLSSSPD